MVNWQVLVRYTCVSVALLASQLALATVPVCNGGTTLSPVRPLGLSNAQVLRWKLTTPNQFTARALVEGRVVKVLPNETGHAHFLIDLDSNATDLLEVVYNEDFGQLPPPRIGAIVVACGDYITADARTGNLPPSPAGAIIHWIHASDTQGHASGFLIVDNVLFGQHIPPGGGRP
jgi:hypothetical protein